MAERPRRRRRWRDRDTCCQTDPREPRLHIVDQRLLTAEQMRNCGDVEPQPIRSVRLDQRRPARRPARQPPHQCRIALRIGGNRDQCRIERARIGQAGTGPRPACRGGLGGEQCVRVDGNLLRRERDSLRATGLGEDEAVALVNRDATARVGQRKSRFAVAAIRGADQLKQRFVFRDGQQLPLAKHPAGWGEVARKHANLSDVRLGHGVVS